MEDSGSTKYVIHAQIKANGVVERPDVVGAIFGQTEGLIGKDLDLRDLQKSGRVGRINVRVSSKGGRSRGKVHIPTSLSKLETSVLAASLETIDRIGPCKAKVKVNKIEDVRASKREQIASRAQQLVSEHFDESASTGDITSVMEGSVKDEIRKYHGLTAGPNVDKSDALLIVEGRSDVLNLLQHGIKNAVAVGGTDISGNIKNATKGKTVTAFLDGDRGGELILKELLQRTDLDYVARAPDGKQVEHLGKDEITTALKDKTSPDEALKKSPKKSEKETSEKETSKKEKKGKKSTQKRKVKRITSKPKKSLKSTLLRKAKTRINEKIEKSEKTGGAKASEGSAGNKQKKKEEATATQASGATKQKMKQKQKKKEKKKPRTEKNAEQEKPEEKPDTLAALETHFEELQGSRKARLLNGDGNEIVEVGVGELFDALRDTENGVTAVVLDGIITQRLLDVASSKGLKELAGAGMGEVVHRPAKMDITVLG